MHLLALTLLVSMGCKSDDGSAPGADSGEPPPPTHCEQLGLQAVDFQDATDDEALYAVAADFTVETSDGAWQFSEHFTGCDSTLVIQDQPRQAEGWPRDLWTRDVDTFFERLPQNTQVLFVSTERSTEDRTASLAGLESDVANPLSAVDAHPPAR